MRYVIRYNSDRITWEVLRDDEYLSDADTRRHAEEIAELDSGRTFRWVLEGEVFVSQ